MTYAKLIHHLFAQSGLQVKQFAEQIGYSLTQVSNVLNEIQPGTLKMVLACLRFAHHGDIQDYLCLPGDKTKEEQELSAKLLFILRNDPRGREGITVNLDYIFEESKRRARGAQPALKRRHP